METRQRTIREGLKEAVRNGAQTAITSLLDDLQKGGVTPANDADFFNFLVAQAIDRGHLQVVKLLFQRGCNPDGQHQGTFHLHRAITRGYDDVIKTVVEEGADVRVQTEVTGKTSLHLTAACSSLTSCEDIIEIIIKSCRTQHFTGMHNNKCSCSTSDDNKENINSYYCGNDTNYLTNNHYNNKNRRRNQHSETRDIIYNDKSRPRSSTPHLYCNFNFLEVRDKVQGNTALHVACAYNNNAAALCLLQHGSNPNTQNVYGDTPLAKLLRPVTRRQDEAHNLSRLDLARRLVALGLVVTDTRLDRRQEIGNEDTFCIENDDSGGSHGGIAAASQGSRGWHGEDGAALHVNLNTSKNFRNRVEEVLMYKDVPSQGKDDCENHTQVSIETNHQPSVCSNQVGLSHSTMKKTSLESKVNPRSKFLKSHLKLQPQTVESGFEGLSQPLSPAMSSTSTSTHRCLPHTDTVKSLSISTDPQSSYPGHVAPPSSSEQHQSPTSTLNKLPTFPADQYEQSFSKRTPCPTSRDCHIQYLSSNNISKEDDFPLVFKRNSWRLQAPENTNILSTDCITKRVENIIGIQSTGFIRDCPLTCASLNGDIQQQKTASNGVNYNSSQTDSCLHLQKETPLHSAIENHKNNLSPHPFDQTLSAKITTTAPNTIDKYPFNAEVMSNKTVPSKRPSRPRRPRSQVQILETHGDMKHAQLDIAPYRGRRGDSKTSPFERHVQSQLSHGRYSVKSEESTEMKSSENTDTSSDRIWQSKSGQSDICCSQVNYRTSSPFIAIDFPETRNILTTDSSQGSRDLHSSRAKQYSWNAQANGQPAPSPGATYRSVRQPGHNKQKIVHHSTENLVNSNPSATNIELDFSHADTARFQLGNSPKDQTKDVPKPLAVKTRAPLREITDTPSNVFQSGTCNKDVGHTTKHNIVPAPTKTVFKFPCREDRIRLRFKRLLGDLSATLTLKQLCRLAILKSLVGRSLVRSVDKLGLPVPVQNFLLHDVLK